MRRTGLLVGLVGGSAAALVLVVVWYLLSFQAGNGSTAGMGQLMAQMMGSQYANSTIAPMPSYVWVTIAALIVLIGGGLVGLVYYLAVPEIKSSAVRDAATAVHRSGDSYVKENWETVLRTSKPDERKVLEVLAEHGGTYLQKFIVKESELSKLRTHRIVSRFAERGIVTAVKSGNTNEVRLASWLREDLQRASRVA